MPEPKKPEPEPAVEKKPIPLSPPEQEDEVTTNPDAASPVRVDVQVERKTQDEAETK